MLCTTEFVKMEQGLFFPPPPALAEVTLLWLKEGAKSNSNFSFILQSLGNESHGPHERPAHQGARCHEIQNIFKSSLFSFHAPKTYKGFVS